MPSFEDSIDVDIPVRAAYDQWIRFEEYPPDVRVAWKSTTGGGSEYATTVLLQPLGEGRTRVTMKADVRPKGLLETVAVNVGLPLLKRRVKGDLTGFKRFIESRRAGFEASRRV